MVVDDGSADPAPVAEVAGRHGARLVAHRRNLGPAAARNTGLRCVATPYVVFCDSDVVPVPGWLGLLRRHLDDPALAVVAPRVLGPEPQEMDTWLERYEQARSSLDLGPQPAAVRVHGTVGYLPSACLLARVAALAGGFDERMRVGEDVDLVWRLLEAGWAVRYEPAAAVRHRHRVTTGGVAAPQGVLRHLGRRPRRPAPGGREPVGGRALDGGALGRGARPASLVGAGGGPGRCGGDRQHGPSARAQ